MFTNKEKHTDECEHVGVCTHRSVSTWECVNEMWKIADSLPSVPETSPEVSKLRQMPRVLNKWVAKRNV